LLEVMIMKRYKYQALIKMLPGRDGEPGPELPGPVSRLVVRARHQATGRSKIFSSLVSIDERPRAGHPRTTVTMVVLGDDVAGYLSPGEGFVLVRGCDIGRGVVTRRIFV
jgi:hypothetical protein